MLELTNILIRAKMEKQPKSTILIAAPSINTFRDKDGNLSAENPYIRKLTKFGLNPFIVTPDMNKDEQDELYRTTSGLLIPGGVDIDPARYGHQPNRKLMKIDPALDELQLSLAKKVIEDDKPILGVCRGAQIMAVASEGTLVQHLPDKTHEKHGISVNANGDTQDHDIYHDVFIDTNTLQGTTKAFEIFQTTRLDKVPTKHHQAVENPGKLLITGRSPGGIAEIIEHPMLTFHIGVQSHPELTDTMDRLFDAYAKAVTVFDAKHEPIAL